MDRLDKLNSVLLAVLVLITAGMLIQHKLTVPQNTGPAPDNRETLIKQYEKRMASDANLYKAIIAAKDENRFKDAMVQLDEMITSHPENPKSYVLKAEIFTEKGNLVNALSMYRHAIEMEPDLVDNKTPLFIGDSVMDLITVARGKLNREKKLKPNDATLTIALDNIYYLQRRIAGGCE